MDGAYGGDYFKKEVMGRVIGAWTPFYGLAALGSFCSDAFRQESIDPSNLSVGLHKIQQKGRAMNDILNIVWILILIQVFIPFVQKRILAGKRLSTMRKIEQMRESRVITMIHRQETMNL